MVSGSWVSRASMPPCGIEKGLWLKSTFFSSSDHSNIGKSTIQQNLNCSSSTSFSSVPTRVRASPANLAKTAGSPAVKKAASPLPRPRLAIRASVGS
ncbi:hypothetical protein D3C81_1711610 [compost metagenome]